ncbi:domain found in IF2B/IF5-domain-containing protein [Kickxella alabastrina]|uniref:domain found in IF2B/IF5-domain-containing protein n=1 Tax=Kickxella alabastrina TaxID=61397 RepID=UPI00221F9F84|nr:domain found in IF2B/IF5-domain-containing protein [Kickxella alabastrina]KAI7822250.1 domain found in IF2B/IF5-domain-containing protein [Kickxella alabastrina]KAJ1946329.1 eukaryotic translation initiation factor 5 [Kickxella alabastrina]
MSGQINIRRDTTDQFYRYKMPRLQGKVEGKGNGIKTVLPNIIDVSRALSRPPAYATKFFGSELGAQVNIDDKNEKYIVNGMHEVPKLQDLLFTFIDKYVLCGNCKNPETDLIITREHSIIRRCMACGQCTDVDMRHRLSTYIIKNPPPKEKKGGQHASATTNGNPAQDGGSSEANSGDDKDFELLAGDAANLKLDDDDDWDIQLDMSEEAVAERQRVLSGGIKLSAGGEDEEADPYDLLGDFIKANKDASDREIFEKAQQLDLDKKHRALVVVIMCLFDEPASVVKNVAKRDKILMAFGDSDKHQRAIIGGFERVIEANMDKLLPKAPAIFKALFDEEVVEEDAFLEWGKKPSKKYVDKEAAKQIHRAAQPFITWLEEADEEDSDEDSA